MCLPTTSPYGYSSFRKEENEDTTDLLKLPSNLKKTPFFQYFFFCPCIYPLKCITFHLEKGVRKERRKAYEKKRCILWLLMSVIGLPLIAQNIIYSNLKELLAQNGDTIAVLRVEKRSRNQIVLTGGADYRITAGDDESMCRRLKKRCFAVRSEEGDLYLNCRKLRYKKLRFGAWYAPAVQLGKNIYFCAMPLGSVIGGNFVEDDDVKLGGNIGDALAASSLVTKRVCYELNGGNGQD